MIEENLGIYLLIAIMAMANNKVLSMKLWRCAPIQEGKQPLWIDQLIVALKMIHGQSFINAPLI